MTRVFILLVIPACFCLSSKAQNTHRFADTTAEWNVLERWFGFFPPGYYYSSSTYKVLNDTSINNTDYQNISGRFLWQDTTLRVFIYDAVNQDEKVIYDFGLGKHDTFTFFNQIFSDTFLAVVDSVDTVIYGSLRKRIFLRCLDFACNDDVWIQGIGSLNSHFLNPFVDESVVDGSSFSLLCYQENETVYSFTSGSCYVGFKQIPREELKVSVSFAYNHLSVEVLLLDDDILFSLFDVYGREIFSQHIFNKKNDLTIPPLGTGLYIWWIETKSGKKQSGKIFIF